LPGTDLHDRGRSTLWCNIAPRSTAGPSTSSGARRAATPSSGSRPSSRKTGTGSYLSGVLERAPQPEPEPASVEPEPIAPEVAPKSRGVAPASKPSRAPAARTAKRIKGRTVSLPDDLFERIIVRAHRKDLTITD
jgi:hypothetical protein